MRNVRRGDGSWRLYDDWTMTAARDSESLPTRSRRQSRGVRSRQEILDAAATLMSKRGYSGTSISELAKESGLPVSSIYWHFESKAGVLAAVMERGASQFFEAMRSAASPDDPDPHQRLLFIMRHGLNTLRAHPEFLRLFMVLLLSQADGDSQVDVVSVVKRVRAEGRDVLGDALRYAYSPWGAEEAHAVVDHLVDLSLALFDGVFIAGQANSMADTDLIMEQSVNAIHTLACRLHYQRP